MRRIILSGLALTLVAGCDDGAVDPNAGENIPVTAAATSSSLTTCGAQVQTIASMTIPSNEYDPQTTVTDTVTTCLTWTGSDYTNVVVLNGTSERNALHDPTGSYTYQNATVTAPSSGGPLSMPAEAATALDFVAASAEVRAAVAADPYFMFRSCPIEMPPPSGGSGGPPILPSTGGDVEGDPCGTLSGVRVAQRRMTGAAVFEAKQRRAGAQDSLLKGLRRVSRVGADGAIRYVGSNVAGGTREVRVHPTARVVLSDEWRNGQEFGRTDVEWKRTPTGFVRTGERQTEEILVDGRLVRLSATLRHRAIRIQPN